jgi:hypothetical protein
LLSTLSATLSAESPGFIGVERLEILERVKI